MRASDKKLADALAQLAEEVREVEPLIERAKRGEWNDFFGEYALNFHHLTAELQLILWTIMRERYKNNDPSTTEALKLQGFIARVQSGEFDATKEESDEWARSEEGQQGMSDLLAGR